MKEELVTKSKTRSGGKCDDVPDHYIEINDFIFKVSELGPTTGPGNGPGRWVCIECAYNYPVSMHYLRTIG